MRVTQNTLTQNLLSDIAKNRAEAASLQRKTSTQKEVNRPSDDPLAFSSAKDIEAVIARNEQFQDNIQSAREQTFEAETAIIAMLDQLTNVKALTVQAANSTLDQAGLDAVADELAGVRQTFIELANTQSNGRYIFAGTATLTKPFEANGDNASYLGNTNDLSIRINNGTDVNVSVDGGDLASIGGETIFDLFERLEASIRANDQSAINADLDTVDSAIDHFTGISANLGDTINRLDFAFQQVEQNNITLKGNFSRLVDANLDEVFADLQNTQFALQAALQTSATLLRTSLLNFI